MRGTGWVWWDGAGWWFDRVVTSQKLSTCSGPISLPSLNLSKRDSNHGVEAGAGALAAGFFTAEELLLFRPPSRREAMEPFTSLGASAALLAKWFLTLVGRVPSL